MFAMGFEAQDVERKVVSILKVLRDSQSPLGSRVIARRLKECGIDLGERAIRYHLRLMDERGLTKLVGRRDGRILTERGIEEVRCALVKDKVVLLSPGLSCLHSGQTSTMKNAVALFKLTFPFLLRGSSARHYRL